MFECRYADWCINQSTLAHLEPGDKGSPYMLLWPSSCLQLRFACLQDQGEKALGTAAALQEASLRLTSRSDCQKGSGETALGTVAALLQGYGIDIALLQESLLHPLQSLHIVAEIEVMCVREKDRVCVCLFCVRRRVLWSTQIMSDCFCVCARMHM
jgi:hypothetical protein